MLVVLESEQGGFVGQVQTDSQGKFLFSQVEQEAYTIKVRHPGYREAVQRVDLSMGPTAYLMIELQPLPGSEPPPVPPEGPASIVAIEPIPAEARKEFEKGSKLVTEQRDFKAGVASLQKAIQLYPSYAQAHILLGTAYMDQRNWKEAESALTKAIQLNNKLAGAYLAMGACLNQQGNFAAAEKALVRGLELEPSAAEGHYELGRAYWALGRWPDAEPHARKAAELAPDLAPVHVLLGNIMLRKRDARSALEEFKEYLRREPKGPLAPPTREIVTKIEKALASPQ